MASFSASNQREFSFRGAFGMILLTASQRYDYVVSWCIGHRTMKETQAQGSGAGWSQVMLGLIASNAQANLDAVVHASWWISSPVVSLKIGLIISFTLLPLSSGCPFVWPTGHVTFITIFLSVQTPSTSTHSNSCCSAVSLSISPHKHPHAL